MVFPFVGVPEIVPVAGSSVNPAGNCPEITDQEQGREPPVADKLAE
jgi:hypothetical protein